MVRRLSAGGKWIRTISTRKRSYRFETDFCRLHNGSRPRNGFTLSFATGDRQIHEAAAGFGSGERRTEAAVGGRDARQHRVEGPARKNGDARCPFPPAIAHPRRTSCPSPPRVHFNEVNSKRLSDTLSALVTSPTQRKRFDRAGDAPRTGSPSQSGRFCCRAVALIRQ